MLDLTSQLIFDQTPGCIAWKDTGLKYQGANKNLLQYMQLDYQQQLQGQSDFELGINPDHLNHLFQQQDKQALLGHSLEMIHGSGQPDDDQTYFVQKGALRDAKGSIAGVIYHCIPWQHDTVLKGLQAIDARIHPGDAQTDYYEFDTHNNTAGLSQRELDCLFLQIRGKSAKQAGEILNLSKRTVESYHDNIKNKFGCQNKSELLVRAVSLGYHRYVPKHLLHLDLPRLFS